MDTFFDDSDFGNFRVVNEVPIAEISNYFKSVDARNLQTKAAQKNLTNSDIF